LDELWSDLVGEPSIAYRAQWALVDDVRAPGFLREKLPPIALDEKRLTALLDDLGNSQYRTRSSATRRLAEMGVMIEGRLRRALNEPRPAEAKKRLERLLEAFQRGPTPEDLRRSRAVQALALAGTPAARR